MIKFLKFCRYLECKYYQYHRKLPEYFFINENR